MKILRKELKQLEEAANKDDEGINPESLKALSGIAKAMTVVTVAMVVLMLMIFLFPIIIFKFW